MSAFNNNTNSFNSQPNITLKYADIFAVVSAITISTLGILGNIIVIFVLEFRTVAPLSSNDNILVYDTAKDLLGAATAHTVFADGTLNKFRE